MIQSKSDLKYYCEKDSVRNLRGKELSKISYLIRILLGDENVIACEYMKDLRRLEFSMNCRYGLWRKVTIAYYRMKLMHKNIRYGILISPNTVGYGLRISHFSQGGVIINCKSMGCNCSVNAGVIIGNKNSQENISTIGDNVSFLIGCKIIGKVSIGDNSVIAPNSVVVKDVPANSVVSGIPAKIIKQN